MRFFLNKPFRYIHRLQPDVSKCEKRKSGEDTDQEEEYSGLSTSINNVMLIINIKCRPKIPNNTFGINVFITALRMIIRVSSLT